MDITEHDGKGATVKFTVPEYLALLDATTAVAKDFAIIKLTPTGDLKLTQTAAFDLEKTLRGRNYGKNAITIRFTELELSILDVITRTALDNFEDLDWFVIADTKRSLIKDFARALEPWQIENGKRSFTD